MNSGRQKGQFLLISAVIIGLMLISTASTITAIQSQRFTHDSTIYDVNTIKDEASQVDMNSPKQRESFRDMVGYLPGYTSKTRAWDRGNDGSYDCFNVTLRKPGEKLELRCIG
ncbi:MAG: hypothetical protein ABEJ91_02010 [Candidatus Nanohaloarchaea archaeon]